MPATYTYECPACKKIWSSKWPIPGAGIPPRADHPRRTCDNCVGGRDPNRRPQTMLSSAVANVPRNTLNKLFR